MNITVFKLGGRVIDDEESLSIFLDVVASIEGARILVHGGGSVATKLATKMGISTRMVEGRRITDAETLELVTMVYGGSINKNLTAALQKRGVNAIGLCGVDANIIKAYKRQHPTIDYGFVGDFCEIDASMIHSLLILGLTPVIAPLTHDGQGQLLNTNADTIASLVASALVPTAVTRLLYCFEKPGVLLDPDDNNSVIHQLNQNDYARLREEKVIADGMIPKLDNAFRAAELGVDVRVTSHFDFAGGTHIVTR